MNIVLPIAGKAQRFLDAGYSMPKPLIMAKGKHIIDRAMSSIKYQGHRLIFIVRQDHIYNFGIDEILKQKFGNDIVVIPVDHITEGAACTCLLAEKYIYNDEPLLIYTPDVYFEPQFDPDTIAKEIDGLILTFKANSPAHSYVLLDENQKIIKTAEKEVISNNAAVGVYYFRSGFGFVDAAKLMIANNKKINNEYYICPIYNEFNYDNYNFRIHEVSKMHVLGTPQELEFFTEYVCTNFTERPIAVCSDHSGFELKESFIKILEAGDIPYIDFGCYSNRDCDYYDYVSQAAKSIKDHTCYIGFGFCRTGQGINILANKYKHLRSALILDSYTAEHAVRHNCANFFAMPSKYLESADLISCFYKIVGTSFDGGRHMTRMKKTIEEAYVD